MEGRSSNIVSGPALVTNETNSIGLPFFAKWVGTTKNVGLNASIWERIIFAGNFAAEGLIQGYGRS